MRIVTKWHLLCTGLVLWLSASTLVLTAQDGLPANRILPATGLYVRTEWAPVIGKTYDGDPVGGITVRSSAGYRFNRRFSAGAGTGMEADIM